MIAQSIIVEKIHFKKNASSGQKHSRQTYKVIGQGQAGLHDKPASSGRHAGSKDVPTFNCQYF